MTEAQLSEAVGLLARFHRLRKHNAPPCELVAVGAVLNALGVKPSFAAVALSADPDDAA